MLASILFRCVYGCAGMCRVCRCVCGCVVVCVWVCRCVMGVQVCVWYGILMLLVVVGGKELGVYQVVWALLYHLVHVQ